MLLNPSHPQVSIQDLGVGDKAWLAYRWGTDDFAVTLPEFDDRPDTELAADDDSAANSNRGDTDGDEL